MSYRKSLSSIALTLALFATLPAWAQEKPGAAPPAEPMPDMPAMPGMAGMAGMDHSHGMSMHAMLGPYGMSREASGTSWQPESTPHEGLHTDRGPWQLMLHGDAMLIYSDQAGRSRDTKTFSENMLMGMASRPLGGGRLGLRAMLTAEPYTIGRTGFPLVLQTGETANGVTPLIDRQHPHDLFMELAATYSLPVGERSSVFAYVAEPGEPALGPPTFMHRFSGTENPEVPLAHHWLDSTHISYGVATLGWVSGSIKLEGSAFNGHEPDENRTNIESPRLNSYSFRASYQPAPNWSLQASFGHLDSPEQLEPGVNSNRSTASAIYNRPLADGNWQTMFAWGRNDRHPGQATNALLLESTASLGQRHTLLGRLERLENDELIGNGQVATVQKLSLGYIYDVLHARPLRAGVGLLGSLSRVPQDLVPRYGSRNLSSFMVFLRLRLTGPSMDSMDGSMKM
ncbi:MAG TPA: hypothetical protein VGR07_22120 [Thermoanaerobaculia bacterium]|nr:hypothetical protein [Thermoanaerobaculia bacterium]